MSGSLIRLRGRDSDCGSERAPVSSPPLNLGSTACLSGFRMTLTRPNRPSLIDIRAFQQEREMRERLAAPVETQPRTAGFRQTRHNKPSPFTMLQGPIPNPALLRNQHTWRLSPNQDEGIA